MTNTVCNPYLKSAPAALPATPYSPPKRRSYILLLLPDDVGLGAVLAADACIDLDADDGIFSGVEDMSGISLTTEHLIVYTDKIINEANTAGFCYQWNVPVLRTNQGLAR